MTINNLYISYNAMRIPPKSFNIYLLVSVCRTKTWIQRRVFALWVEAPCDVDGPT